MLFNSYFFIFILLPISLIGYYQINKIGKYTVGLTFLLLASFFFIGYTNIIYLAILIPCILINYACARKLNSETIINENRKRKALLCVAIILNLVILLVFKYYNFFVANVNKGFGQDFATINIILPLGISFYTFQQITYLVDCYRDKSIQYGLIEYATYISFYPQFVQGPIVLQSELIPQLLDKERKSIDYEYMAKGLYRFVLGLSKKVLVADNLSLIVDGGYIDTHALNSASSIALILAYTMQIYFDFSGYSDMAIGIGKMFHIDLPENFDSPYKAKSIEDFWDRWHITLTRFFTRYVYIPLGGSREGMCKTYCNVFFVFLLSGLWHGAEWSFILWGIMHGFAMMMKRMLRQNNISLPTSIEALLTFIYVSIAWVFFRAKNIEEGFQVLKGLAAGGWCGLIREMYENFDSTVEGAMLCRADILRINDHFSGIIVILVIGICVAVSLVCKNTKEKEDYLVLSKRTMFYVVVLGLWCILSFSGVTKYIYWNF